MRKYEQEMAAYQAKRDEIDKALEVTAGDMQWGTLYGSDITGLILELNNKSDKDIVVVKGKMLIHNGPKFRIGREVELKKTIPSMKTTRTDEMDLLYYYTTFDTEELRLKSMAKESPDGIEKTWYPTYIQFADGTSIETPAIPENPEEKEII